MLRPTLNFLVFLFPKGCALIGGWSKPHPYGRALILPKLLIVPVSDRRSPGGFVIARDEAI